MNTLIYQFWIDHLANQCSSPLKAIRRNKKWYLIPHYRSVNNVSGLFLTLKMKSLSITQKTFHNFASSLSPDSFLSLPLYVSNTPVRLTCSISKSTSSFIAWCPWIHHYIFLESLFSICFLTWKISTNQERLRSKFNLFVYSMSGWNALIAHLYIYIAFITLIIQILLTVLLLCFLL